MAKIILIFGMVCSGKTTQAKLIAQTQDVIRFSPDEWLESISGDKNNREFADKYRDNLEQLQWNFAKGLLNKNISVLLENGFWSKEERMKYISYAKENGFEIEIYIMDTDKAVIVDRLYRRNADLKYGHFSATSEEIDLWFTWMHRPEKDELAMYDRYYIIK